jgi:hypothetical protein
LKKPSWSVVLLKETHSKKEVANAKNIFITMLMEPCGLNVPMGLPPTSKYKTFDKSIELLNKNNLLACISFKVDE